MARLPDYLMTIGSWWLVYSATAAWIAVLVLVPFLLARMIYRGFRKKDEPSAPRPRGAWLRPVARVCAVVLAITLLLALHHEFFTPLGIGGGSAGTDFWMSRAAQASDPAEKEAYLTKVAISWGKGWFVASQAITRIESRAERCTLRKMLAAIPNISNQAQLLEEARKDCVTA